MRWFPFSGPLRLAAVLALLAVAAVVVPNFVTAKPSTGDRPVTGKTLHSFEVRDIDGKKVSLAQYRGKIVLVVNTASKCGLTPQYEGLETLYEKYRGQGFEVLAFPANDFLGQEPGTDDEIQEFCSTRYAVKFPLFSKISVKGKTQAPLYQWLTKDSGFPGDIEWNFAKFLVGPDGKVVARFHPKTKPLDASVTSAIDSALAANTSNAGH
ncbi:MAG: glutathione peroxidase [Candidatus Eisenbacteria bacterium]|uniref:Glutathione peroxidase n=1 Tax=Eiseniibacteriota bacterium TaxID=2212470 RepID=A0A933SET1_UNCEI|nr:glutathione peroxidase [Candidatus Eisenbacteria bacterium]